MLSEEGAQQWLALWRTFGDGEYTRAKIVVVDAIAAKCPISAVEMCRLASSTLDTLELILAMLDRPRTT